MKKIIFICVLLGSTFLKAQSTFLVNDYQYRSMVERLSILYYSDSNNFVSPDAYYSREDLVKFALNLNQDTLSKVDAYNLGYLLQDNSEFLPDSLIQQSKRPIFKKLYRTPANFAEVKVPYFSLKLSPVLNTSIGTDLKQETSLFLNTRGAELRGQVDNRIGFYAFVADNQAVFPTYMRQSVYANSAVYGENFWKEFKEEGFDFFSARGYITARLSKHISAQWGYDRNFIGNGYRSLILSDVGGAYTFLKLKTKIWKLDYTNLFADLTASVPSNSAGLILTGKYPRKQMAFHHLGYNISKNVNIGVFEAIMYGQPDSLGGNGWNVNYLNPIIFYRAIEQNLGSAGNALLGLDFQWKFLHRFSLYGQIVLDEFKLSHIRAQDGWWANKQSGQLGLKYINVAGVKNLDLQMEMNVVRPYMYGHIDNYTSYSHFNQALAHPLGANFYEFLGIIKAQPLPKLHITNKVFWSRVGKDTLGTNWGQDILQSYRSREQDYDNEIGQGFTSDILFWDLTVSYQVKHNLFIDVRHVYRKEVNELSILSNENQFLSVGLRLNMRHRLQEF
ncbi:MAG: hypothetical protein GY827_07795 [Cytophagales bacterium]|nr:hypothetical protein [Cytophagales bacterium]